MEEVGSPVVKWGRYSRVKVSLLACEVTAPKGQFASPDYYSSSCFWWREIGSEIQSEGPCHFGSSMSSSNLTMDNEQREFRSIMLKKVRRVDGPRKFQQLTTVSVSSGGSV